MPAMPMPHKAGFAQVPIGKWCLVIFLIVAASWHLTSMEPRPAIHFVQRVSGLPCKSPLPHIPDHKEDSGTLEGVWMPRDFQSLPVLPAAVWNASIANQVARRCLPLQAILRRVVNGHAIKIQVYGGSMTLGTDCCPKHPSVVSKACDKKNCSWASQFVSKMHEAFPGLVELDHQGRGGCNVECASFDMVRQMVDIQNLHPNVRVPDMLILDFSQNGWYNLELFIRVYRLYLPSTLIVILSNRNRNVIDGPWRSVQLETLAEHYSIPMLNYHLAVTYANVTGAVENISAMWPGSPTLHPTWDAHAYYADMLSYWLNDHLKQMGCNSSIRYASQPVFHPVRSRNDLQRDRWAVAPLNMKFLDQTNFCVRPQSQHVAAYKVAPGTPQHSPNQHWIARQDAPGKWGWITTVPGGERLHFNLTFGKLEGAVNATLSVQFLTTYENIGTARMDIDSASLWRRVSPPSSDMAKSFIIPGRIQEHVSVATTWTFVPVSGATEPDHASVSFLLLDGPKFKLISLIAC